MKRGKNKSKPACFEAREVENECDNDALYFLTLLIIVLISVFFFKSEILQLFYSSL